jgi:hypothetical protein
MGKEMAFGQVYYACFRVIVCPKTSEDLRICSHFMQTRGDNYPTMGG